MTIKTIAQILDLHSVPYSIKNNRIYATAFYTLGDGTSGEEIEDVTGYTLKQLRDWLGY